MDFLYKKIRKELLIIIILLLVFIGGIGVVLLLGNICTDKKSLVKEYFLAEPDYGEWYRKNSLPNPIRYTDNGGCYSKSCSGHITNKARIMCAGDLMCEPVMSQSCFFNNKFFFEPYFVHVKKLLESSDFAIANLETSVSDNYPYAIDVHRLEDRYHCNAPKEYLEALRYAGFDAFALANNHTCDTGVQGLQDTIANLDDMGFLHTGAYTKADDNHELIVDINGIKVAFLSYTEHFNSDLDMKCFTKYGREVMLNKYSSDKLKNDILEAKKLGAEFILVYIHFWCKDYTHEVSESQIEVAKEIAEAGADCIVGGHPHAVQKYDRIVTSKGKNVPVNYCLGNFITSDSNMITRQSYIYELFLEKDNTGKVFISDEKYIPCRVIEQFEKSGFVVFPTPENWRMGTYSELLSNAESEISKYVGNLIKIDRNNL